MGRGLKPIMVIHHLHPSHRKGNRHVWCCQSHCNVLFSLMAPFSKPPHTWLWHQGFKSCFNHGCTDAFVPFWWKWSSSIPFQHVRPKRSHAKRPPHWQGRSMPSTIGLVGHVALLKHRRALPLAMRRFLVFPHPLLLVEMLLWCHPWELATSTLLHRIVAVAGIDVTSLELIYVAATSLGPQIPG